MKVYGTSTEVYFKHTYMKAYRTSTEVYFKHTYVNNIKHIALHYIT